MNIVSKPTLTRLNLSLASNEMAESIASHEGLDPRMVKANLKLWRPQDMVSFVDLNAATSEYATTFESFGSVDPVSGLRIVPDSEMNRFYLEMDSAVETLRQAGDNLLARWESEVIPEAIGQWTSQSSRDLVREKVASMKPSPSAFHKPYGVFNPKATKDWNDALSDAQNEARLRSYHETKKAVVGSIMDPIKESVTDWKNQLEGVKPDGTNARFKKETFNTMSSLLKNFKPLLDEYSDDLDGLESINDLISLADEFNSLSLNEVLNARSTERQRAKTIVGSIQDVLSGGGAQSPPEAAPLQEEEDVEGWGLMLSEPMDFQINTFFSKEDEKWG